MARFLLSEFLSDGDDYFQENLRILHAVLKMCDANSPIEQACCNLLSIAAQVSGADDTRRRTQLLNDFYSQLHTMENSFVFRLANEFIHLRAAAPSREENNANEQVFKKIDDLLSRASKPCIRDLQYARCLRAQLRLAIDQFNRCEQESYQRSLKREIDALSLTLGRICSQIEDELCKINGKQGGRPISWKKTIVERLLAKEPNLTAAKIVRMLDHDENVTADEKRRCSELIKEVIADRFHSGILTEENLRSEYTKGLLVSAPELALPTGPEWQSAVLNLCLPDSTVSGWLKELHRTN